MCIVTLILSRHRFKFGIVTKVKESVSKYHSVITLENRCITSIKSRLHFIPCLHVASIQYGVVCLLNMFFVEPLPYPLNVDRQPELSHSRYCTVANSPGLTGLQCSSMLNITYSTDEHGGFVHNGRQVFTVIEWLGAMGC